MGAGAATGAVLIRGAVGAGMAPLWWIAAATCVVAVVTVRLAFLSSQTAPPPPPSPSPPPAAAPAATMRPVGGYRMVFADRALLRVLLAAVLMSAAGYGVYNAGLPVLAVLAADPAVMSWVSVANCLTVVVGLPLALRVGRRLRSPQLLVMTAAVWSVGWLLCTVQGQTPLIDARMTLPLTAALFGLGELLMAGALPAMVNALAPAALRGRYNAPSPSPSPPACGWVRCSRPRPRRSMRSRCCSPLRSLCSPPRRSSSNGRRPPWSSPPWSSPPHRRSGAHPNRR